ncbi:hypothetical protein [Paenibacillus polymyxa]|uniref:Uncharacterized protein n=1 Tax=Paenibacillus polymyxa (strain SC2) TaxID=886882 RepID=E3EJY5_PAEPS|nr:hypothetical protein [Paenibacillus polymyxa]ADO60004.1 hypothetical protein PPSC2_28165 [Paenibacillus polymyxa SC2]WPQ59779.1 hypothetical protein SKN87_26175 [Paenibacillus polymyxa]
MKKKLVVVIATEAEAKRKEQGLSSEETIKWFVEQMKDKKISVDGWFTMDDELRKISGHADWFWIIRTVRNNLDKYTWKIEHSVQKPKLHVTKQSENHWLVWGVLKGETRSAEIISFNECGFHGSKKRYRVDVEGSTKESLIEHFQTAKAIAMFEVKKAFA